MPSASRPKFVASLTFRGFEIAPTEVESLVGTAARGRPLQRSFAQWQLAFADSTRLDEMLPALIESIGGVDRLISVRDQVAPEFFEIDLSLWIKDSDEQDGGFLDQETIAMLARLGVTLSLGFYARNPV